MDKLLATPKFIENANQACRRATLPDVDLGAKQTSPGPELESHTETHVGGVFSRGMGQPLTGCLSVILS